MYADGVSMENIIKWADADENLVKAVIAEYKESRAQKKYMNKKNANMYRRWNYQIYMQKLW